MNIQVYYHRPILSKMGFFWIITNPCRSDTFQKILVCEMTDSVRRDSLVLVEIIMIVLMYTEKSRGFYSCDRKVNFNFKKMCSLCLKGNQVYNLSKHLRTSGLCYILVEVTQLKRKSLFVVMDNFTITVYST